jgi:hypothetical protein
LSRVSASQVMMKRRRDLPRALANLAADVDWDDSKGNT